MNTRRLTISAFADTTIDLTQTGSVNLWKYDLSSAQADGVWDSSYVSTGVRDQSGVEAGNAGQHRQTGGFSGANQMDESFSPKGGVFKIHRGEPEPGVTRRFQKLRRGRLDERAEKRLFCLEQRCEGNHKPVPPDKR